MKIIAWNCRGLENTSAVRGLLDLQKLESPDILFLSETKMDWKRIERFRWILKMPNLVVKDCNGLSGRVVDVGFISFNPIMSGTMDAWGTWALLASIE